MRQPRHDGNENQVVEQLVPQNFAVTAVALEAVGTAKETAAAGRRSPAVNDERLALVHKVLQQLGSRDEPRCAEPRCKEDIVYTVVSQHRTYGSSRRLWAA